MSCIWLMHSRAIRASCRGAQKRALPDRAAARADISKKPLITKQIIAATIDCNYLYYKVI